MPRQKSTFGIILTGREPDAIAGLREFTVSFLGGGVAGFFAGRLLLWIIPRVGDDRLAEATLTLAFAYLAFIAAERLFHVSGVVAVLAAGLTVSALGRSRISPENWTFLTDLWEQIAFWARSLIFVLASILVPRLLVDIGSRDLVLFGILIAAAFGARIFSLFGLLPPLERLGLTQRIDASYKLAISWGGLRGALTLVLALAITENDALPRDIQRFVAVLATGLVLFTLFKIGPKVAEALRLHRRAAGEALLKVGRRITADDPVCLHLDDGRALRPGSFTGWCSRHGIKAHSLRHLNASTLLQTQPVAIVAERLAIAART